MYLQHYGLRDKPFKLAHHPAYYYPASHQQPLNDLCYSIEERQGLTTLVGEPGTGKTTLLRRLYGTFDVHIRGILISDSSLGGRSLVRQIAGQLGLPRADPTLLPRFLEREIAVGRTPVLLLDEAQGLSPHQLDEVRSLSNLELPGRKLLEMILAGQPSLERVLAKREYAALRQRVAVRTYILPFDREHTAAYIEHRLRVAGAHQRPIFTAAAIAAIHSRSGGIPRLINLICERALLVSFAEDLKVVDLYQVEQAFSELRTEQDSEASTVPGPDLQVNEKALRRLESRFDALEEKIDRLGRALARAGLVPVDEADRVAPPAGIEPPLPRPSEPAADDVSADPADLSKRLIP